MIWFYNLCYFNGTYEIRKIWCYDYLLSILCKAIMFCLTLWLNLKLSNAVNIFITRQILNAKINAKVSLTSRAKKRCRKVSFMLLLSTNGFARYFLKKEDDGLHCKIFTIVYCLSLHILSNLYIISYDTLNGLCKLFAQ